MPKRFRFYKFMFHWWGGLRPAFVMCPDERWYKPLFLGLWVETKKPENVVTW